MKTYNEVRRLRDFQDSIEKTCQDCPWLVRKNLPGLPEEKSCRKGQDINNCSFHNNYYNDIMVVITGGPCSGKTTIINKIKKFYSVCSYHRVKTINEVATTLFKEGYPAPDPWSQEWQDKFQRAIYKRQTDLERGLPLIGDGNTCYVLDRGIFDIAAYLGGGIEEFRSKYARTNNRMEDHITKYDLVIHLESLATQDPQKYEELVSTNPHRFEDLERAQEIETKTREAWDIHPNRVIISEDSINEIYNKVLDLIDTVA